MLKEPNTELLPNVALGYIKPSGGGGPVLIFGKT